jgi:ribonuclease HII
MIKEYIIGIDEVGKGSLFYDMVLGFTISSKPKDVIDKELRDIEVTDSKKITSKKRESLYSKIIELLDDYFFIHVSKDEIDSKGIYNAEIEGIKRGIYKLREKYISDEESIKMIYMDGSNQFGLSIYGYKYKCIIKGDLKEPIIGAASILAKTYRDGLIIDLVNKEEELNKYDLKSNKGYGTAKHRLALQSYGAHELHRNSYIRRIIN